MDTLVQHRRNGSAHTGRGPSPNIWAPFPWMACIEDPGLGFVEFQDFVSGGLITAPTTHAALVGLPISGFSSSAGQITYGNGTYTTDQAVGTLVLAETTTRESTSIRSDAVPYRISANYGMLCFEARIKISTVATNEIGFFVGLLEDETLTVDIPIVGTGSDTGALADKDLVGFHKPKANTTTFDGGYKAGGVTAVVSNDEMGTLAADTYIKLGMVFDPNNSNKLAWYVNGVKQATEKTIPDNTGTDFPADVNLGWCIALAVGSAASDNTLTVDWIRVGQLFQ